jgi:hypothetical protein
VDYIAWRKGMLNVFRWGPRKLLWWWVSTYWYGWGWDNMLFRAKVVFVPTGIDGWQKQLILDLGPAEIDIWRAR